MMGRLAAVAFLAVVVAAAAAAARALPLGDAFAHGWGPEQVVQHSGYIDVNSNTGHIFFWMFESRSNPSQDPLVLWMTGGPGCSSELAIFYEQGPYRISESGNVTSNAYAWNSKANVIFVDQPIGTGFSYGEIEDYVTNERQVGEDMYEFMQGFYQSFPQYKNLDFFVTGESYAGHYVPAVSNRIYKGNKAREGFIIPFRGLAIGNGMVTAEHQYGDYIKYAKEKKLITKKSVLNRLQEDTDMCLQALKINKKLASPICNSIVGSIQSYGGNFNVYDVREKCIHSPLCYDFSPLDRLVQQPDVQQQLGVSDQARWTECSGKVYQYLEDDWFTRCDVLLPELLEDGIHVLVYSGVEDFICNYVGGLEWVSKMEWSGQTKINSKNLELWAVNEKVSGSFKSEGPLTFLKVYAAGHMVPMNQPQVALAMLESFMNGNQFQGTGEYEDNMASSMGSSIANDDLVALY